MKKIINIFIGYIISEMDLWKLLEIVGNCLNKIFNNFDDLNKIQIDMDSSEIKKRIRATLYKKFRPKLYFNNFNFELNED